MKNNPPELNAILRNFVRDVTKHLAPGVTYKDKEANIRVKWVDRGTQKMIKIYDGALVLADMLPGKAQQGGGLSLSEDEDV